MKNYIINNYMIKFDIVLFDIMCYNNSMIITKRWYIDMIFSKYITIQESKKCQRVANVFDKLYDQIDSVVINTGKYGFAFLKYYDCNGFQFIENYTNSIDLFKALWHEWLKEKLIELCINTPIINLNYKEMYNKLSSKTQNEILRSKKYFLSMANNKHIKLNSSPTMKLHISYKERAKCRILVNILKNELEKNDIFIKETEKFGFVMLTYYEPIANFDSAIVFTNFDKMYDTLLDEWFLCQIIKKMKEKHEIDKDIDVFYNELSKKEKEKLKKKKANLEAFIKKAGFIKI